MATTPVTATTTMSTLTADQREAIRKVNQGRRGFLDQLYSNAQPQMDQDIVESANVVDGSMTGKCTIEIDLDTRYKNGGGALHAAAASAIFDCYTCLAFTPLLPDWSAERHNQGPPGGLTRALNVTYLRPVPLPARVRVDSEVISNGKTATFAKATMTDPSGKKVYATCEHHKIQIPPPKNGDKNWTRTKAKL